MGTTLTGTKPKDTYDSLIKVTDNGPLSGTAKYLSDGLGNDSVLALSTSRVGVGTTSPSVFGVDSVNASDSVYYRAASSSIVAHYGAANALGVGLLGTFSNHDLAFYTNSTEKMVLTSAGGVGIGTSSPISLLDIENSNGSTISLGTAAAAGSIASKKFTTLNFNGFNNTTMAQIQSWDESASTGYGYLTFSTFTGSALTEKVRITNAGVLSLTQGQLQFPATQVPSADPNTLDDYEEGTWTMGVSFGGGSTGVTYTANTGTYTKIGRQVTVNGYLLLSNKGSSTGAARLTGLPFTLGVADANLATASLYFENITFANQFMGFAIAGTTVCALYETTEAGAYTVLNDTNFANNSSIIVSLTYFV